MVAKELRQQRAKLITDAQAILASATADDAAIASAEAMLAQSDTMLARINLTERADTAFAQLTDASNHRAAQVSGPTIGFSAQREAAISTRIRLHGSKVIASFNSADADYYVESIARDKRILSALGAGSRGRLSAEDQQHCAARFGELSSEYRAAAASTPDTAGGYTVSPIYETEVLVAMKAQGGMRDVSRSVMTSTGAIISWPTLDDTAQVATIVGGENTTVAAGTDLSLGRQSLSAYTYSTGVLPIPLQLVQDSAVDFGAMLTDAIAGRFVRGQNAHFTTGTGSNQPYGVVPKAALGKTGASGQTITCIYEDLVDLIHSVNPVYRAGAVWMMNDATIAIIRKLKDSQGHPLWNPDLTSGTPLSLLNYPIVTNMDMAVMAASAKSILFGNFQNYIIRDTLGMQIMVLRERYADLLQVAYLAFARTDGNLVSAASPIKYYITAAS